MAQEASLASDVMGRVARLMFELRPLPSRLELAPFRAADGGIGDCDTELRDRLIEALKLEQSDPNNAIVDRRIDVRLTPALSAGSEAGARLAGRYGGAPDGQIWIEAQVMSRDGDVLAALPRTRVVGLVCQGLRMTLADAAETAIRSRNASGLTLSLPRPDPRVGDLVAITLRNTGEEAARVLCLNIAADNTSQLLTPLRSGAPRLVQRGQLVWPRDFAASGGPAGPICFEREQADAVLCLGLPQELPSIDRHWREAWPPSSAEPAELSAHATMDLINEALVDSRTAATMLRYSVRSALPASAHACSGRSQR